MMEDGGRIALDSGAEGRSALLLVESLLHGLIEARSLDVAAALDIVDTAISVEGDRCDDAGESRTTSRSLDQLHRIRNSLAIDLLDRPD